MRVPKSVYLTHRFHLSRHAELVLGTAPIVERVLDISGILKLINVVPSVERALAG